MWTAMGPQGTWVAFVEQVACGCDLKGQTGVGITIANPASLCGEP